MCIQVEAEQWLTGWGCDWTTCQKKRALILSSTQTSRAIPTNPGTDEMLFCPHLYVSFAPQISSPHSCWPCAAPKVCKLTLVHLMMRQERRRYRSSLIILQQQDACDKHLKYPVYIIKAVRHYCSSSKAKHCSDSNALRWKTQMKSCFKKKQKKNICIWVTKSNTIFSMVTSHPMKITP